MKLKKLYVQKYKNLVDLYVDFESKNGLSIIIGNNGSGKSNLLEVISGIFHDLFKEKSERKISCNYCLEYEQNDVICRIEQKKGILRCYDPKYRSRDVFIEHHAPNNIIGLYSGEENRLWLQYYQSFYQAYIRRIRTHRFQQRMRLILVDKRYWSVALLVLLLSENTTLEPFIKHELGILEINKITLQFDFELYDKTNSLLKAFIDRINPEHKLLLSYQRKDLSQIIYTNTLTDSDGDPILDSEDDPILESSGITDAEVFRNIIQANIPPKEKIIKRIDIQFNNGITIQELSEGEKKLILVKAILEILADENTLLLLDEPDAHLHESRKQTLINLMRDYSNRQIVIATHSPIIAQLANDDEIIMLENTEGNASLLSQDKKEKIKMLSGGTWDIISQNNILNSDKPLLVFEGKTDIKYVKKAISMLQQTEPKYANIDVDFINCGGADNAQFFIKDLLSVIPTDKRVFMFFDRDNEGRVGAAAILGFSQDDERITKYTDNKMGNLTIGFIPYREGVTSGDFLIEDYFLWEPTVKRLVDKEIENHHQPFKQLPSLAKKIKSNLEKHYDSFSLEEFKGFTSIVEKLYSISTEDEDE